jgi:hypothetical protein
MEAPGLAYIDASWPLALRQVLGDGVDEAGNPIEKLE